MICTIYLFFSLIYDRCNNSKKIDLVLKRNTWLITIMILLFAVVFPFLMDKLSGRMQEILWNINGALGSRFSFASAVMNHYDLNLFGNVFDFSYLEYLYGNYVVDNGYVNLLYNFGIIAFVFYVFFSVKSIQFLCKKNNGKLAFLLILLNLWGTVENILFVPSVNVAVFFLGCWLNDNIFNKNRGNK